MHGAHNHVLFTVFKEEILRQILQRSQVLENWANTGGKLDVFRHTHSVRSMTNDYTLPGCLIFVLLRRYVFVSRLRQDQGQQLPHIALLCNTLSGPILRFLCPNIGSFDPSDPRY